jgi:predicted DCC family thiol-disulfide oxidoreductase YuxK
MPNHDKVVLLYDGSCGFCARSVQFVLSRERRRRDLHFAPLEGEFGRGVTARFPELSGVDSLVLFFPGKVGQGGNPTEPRVLVRSEAVLAVADYLGGMWGVLGKLASPVPRSLRDAIYKVVARHRHKIPGADSCLLPTPEQQSRFH